MQNLNRAEGTGGNAQPAIVTTFNVEVGRFVNVNADDGANLADLRRQAGQAGLAGFSPKMDADLACHGLLTLLRAWSGARAFRQRGVRFEVFQKHLPHQVAGLDNLWITQPIINIQSLAARDEDSLLAH